MVLSIATPLLIGFIIEGAAAVLLLAAVVATAVGLKKQRIAREQAVKAPQSAPDVPETPPVTEIAATEVETEIAAQTDTTQTETVTSETASEILSVAETASEIAASETAATVTETAEAENAKEAAATEIAATETAEAAEPMPEPAPATQTAFGFPDTRRFAEYSRSFTAKLIQAEPAVKDYYAELANYLLSYKKVRNRLSWAYSSFNRGRRQVAKLNIRGKTLCLYLALDPAEFAGTKYFVRDVSARKKYRAVPLMVKVKSGRGVAFAKQLIDRLAEKFALTKQSTPAAVCAADFPYDTSDNLIARRLIKVKIPAGTDGNASVR